QRRERGPYGRVVLRRAAQPGDKCRLHQRKPCLRGDGLTKPLPELQRGRPPQRLQVEVRVAQLAGGYAEERNRAARSEVDADAGGMDAGVDHEESTVRSGKGRPGATAGAV